MPASAVCAFRMSDVVRSFEGAFREQRTPQSAWLPVRDVDTPQPHPAKVGCVSPSACHCCIRIVHTLLCTVPYVYGVVLCEQECPTDSTALSDQTLSFIKTHPLMDRAVPPAGRGPQLIQTSPRSVLYCLLVGIYSCSMCFISAAARQRVVCKLWLLCSLKCSSDICVFYSYRLTAIAIDWQVKAANGMRYDVIFVGTGEWP
jgi:hypothetical protein